MDFNRIYFFIVKYIQTKKLIRTKRILMRKNNILTVCMVYVCMICLLFPLVLLTTTPHGNIKHVRFAATGSDLSLGSSHIEAVRQHQTPPTQLQTKLMTSFPEEEQEEEAAAAAEASSLELMKMKRYLVSSNSSKPFINDNSTTTSSTRHQLVQSRSVLSPVSHLATNYEALDTSSSHQRSAYSECALILQRTYIKDNSVRTFMQSSSSDGKPPSMGKTEQACITYRHIDAAVEQANHQLKFAALRQTPAFEVIHSSLEPDAELVAAIGELNMLVTQILAQKFDLSNDELLNGLPLIDMSKTKFWQFCPLLARQDAKCELNRYRTFTAHCNNIRHPTWGAAMTPFARYLPPVHPDGIQVPRKSVVLSHHKHLMSFDHGPIHLHQSHHSPPFELVPRPSQSSSHHQHHGYHHDEPSPSMDLEHASLRLTSFDDPSSDSFGTSMASAASVRFVSHAPVSSSLTTPHEPTNHEDSVSATTSSSKLDSNHQNRWIDSTSDNDDQQTTPELNSNRNFARRKATLISANNGIPLIMSPSLADSRSSNELILPEASTNGFMANRESMASELPPPRVVSVTIHRDFDLPSHDFSVLFMSWGQLLDHDMSRATQPPATIKCCGADKQNKLCLPIQVPPDDPLYAKFNVKCLEFRRSLAGVRPSCVLGPRVHQNAVTAPIDANFVYGSSQAEADALRLFTGGRLRDRNWFRTEGLKPLLPAQDVDPDKDCIARPANLFCFRAGDVRANEQTHLTVLHTLYMRQHNRMADKLADLNPHWDDEKIYQETRHIMAATVQHVLLNEYLPLLIGHKMVELYNLTALGYEMDPRHSLSLAASNNEPIATLATTVHFPETQSDNGDASVVGNGQYWHGYDPSVTTSVSNSFAAAAFRQGHTFIQDTVERYNKHHEFLGAEKLRHLLKQPFLIYTPGMLDELTGGMINQPAQSFDPFISEEIAGHLFQEPTRPVGHDLPSINIQRGREQGLPGYNIFREWCGLPRAETFEQLEPYLTNRTAYQYSKLFKHVDDIDLWSGGISERKLTGAAVGPTFACLIARQFANTRRGDRFWYENPGLPSSFNPKQLAEIRKISLSKIICANSDDLPTIQRLALRMPHPVMNPRVPCHSLPDINLSFWAS